MFNQRKGRQRSSTLLRSTRSQPPLVSSLLWRQVTKDRPRQHRRLDRYRRQVGPPDERHLHHAHLCQLVDDSLRRLAFVCRLPQYRLCAIELGQARRQANLSNVWEGRTVVANKNIC